MQNRTEKLLLITTLLLITSTVASASLTVTPDPADGKKDSIEFQFNITNQGKNSAQNITVKLPTTGGEGSSDPFNIPPHTINISNPDTTEIESQNITSRDGEDGTNDTAFLNLKSSINSSEYILFNISIDLYSSGTKTINSELSNGEEYSYSVLIDNQPPEITSKSPENSGLTSFSQTVEASYTDDSNISLANLTINSKQVKRNEETEISYTASKTELEEGQNNVSLYLEDRLSNGKKYNWSFSLAVEPIIDWETVKPEKESFVTEKSPEIEAELGDPSKINFSKTWLKIDSQEKVYSNSSSFQVEDKNSTTPKIVFDNPYVLEEGIHHVKIHAVDRTDSNNSKEFTWNFTVDTEKPKIESISVSDGDVYTGNMPVYIEANDEKDDTETSGINKVELELEGEEITIEEPVSGEYIGKYDTEEFSDGEHELEIRVEDIAGNINKKTKQIVIDNQEPEITYTKLFPNPTNVPPILEITAEEEETKIVEAEYFIENDPGKGSGKSLKTESNSGNEFTYRKTLNINELENGEYQLGVRVKDQAQHWSELEEIELEINRSLESELEFSEKPPLKAKQGSSGQKTVTVTNAGKVDCKVNLTADSKFNVEIEPDSQRIRESESKTFTVRAEIGNNTTIGNHTITLIASSPTTIEKIELTLVAEADIDTQEEIEENLEQIKNRYQEFKDRKEKWEKQISSEKSENITEELEGLNQTIEKIEEKIDGGNYRFADRKIPETEKHINTTETILNRSIEAYKNSKWQKTLLMIVIGLIIASAVVIGYSLIPPEEGYGKEGFVFRPGGKHPARNRIEGELERTKRKLEKKIEKIKEKLSNAKKSEETSEEEKEAWNGYTPS
ncbi:MAG: hypothetical protein MUP58_03415 [Candidatus Nanohaloarchaeota archaeon QJJ-9]|nr:hypothetical protein [Candidatus Nanohaloarchaeota archaeon QJJ-9]